MALARFKDLCIDANDSHLLGEFWGAVLRLNHESLDNGDSRLTGDRPEKTVWINTVPEEKTVKHRVHIDVHAASVDEITALGATMLEPAEEYGRRWSVMADSEGGEFCVFVREPDELPDYRLYEVNVDCAEAQLLAEWWADVLDSTLGDQDGEWWWIEDVPGLPFVGIVFAPVPEPKMVKNRIHMDFTVSDEGGLEELMELGAEMLVPAGENRWNVMADPEGNEFCVFSDV